MTVNLAPTDVRKDSSGLDLPIAVGLLASYGMVPEAAVHFLMRFTKKGLVFIQFVFFIVIQFILE